MKQRGVVHLALPVLLIIAAVVVFLLIRFGVINNPFPNLPFLQSSPSVSLKTEYKNPFDKDTQYVNPFETYKNPFTVSKE